MCGCLCMPWFVAPSLSMHMCLSHSIHPFLMGAMQWVFLLPRASPCALGSSLAPCCCLCSGPLHGQPLPLSLSAVMFMGSHMQPPSRFSWGCSLGAAQDDQTAPEQRLLQLPAGDDPAVPAADPATCHPLVPRHRLG